jgi:hypothetical protein
MQWNDVPKSELVQQLNAKTLDHPTNASFDIEAWRLAFRALPCPTERDMDIAISAIHFGKELASLRQIHIPQTTEGFSRPRLVRLLAAFANQQYLTLRHKVVKGLKAKVNGGVLDMERTHQLFVKGAGGQEMTPDDLITNLVDSLPHWLFHIWKVPDDVPSNEPQQAIQFAARASHIVSIEHSLRQLWLNARWIGTRLFTDGDALIDTPRDRVLAERVRPCL